MTVLRAGQYTTIHNLAQYTRLSTVHDWAQFTNVHGTRLGTVHDCPRYTAGQSTRLGPGHYWAQYTSQEQRSVRGPYHCYQRWSCSFVCLAFCVGRLPTISQPRNRVVCVITIMIEYDTYRFTEKYNFEGYRTLQKYIPLLLEKKIFIKITTTGHSC